MQRTTKDLEMGITVALFRCGWLCPPKLLCWMLVSSAAVLRGGGVFRRWGLLGRVELLESPT